MNRRFAKRHFPKLSHSPNYRHEAWDDPNATPAPTSHPDAYNVERTWPESAPAKAKRKRPISLSRRQIRKRLSHPGLDNAILAERVRAVAAKPSVAFGFTYLGWDAGELKRVVGKQGFRALTRGVSPSVCVIDEYSCAFPSAAFVAFAEQARSFRKLNTTVIQATQDRSDLAIDTFA